MPDTEKELRLADALSRIESKLTEIEHLITGNGEPEKGIIVRLDRVERHTQTMSKVASWVAGIFAAILVAISLAILKVAATKL